MAKKVTEKKVKRARVPRYTTTEMTVADAVSNAYGEFQSLRDEISDWASNMEGANMEHLPKYEEVSEARDNLENFADNEPDVPEGLQELKVTVTEDRKARSRAARMSNAVAHLQAVIDLCNDEEAIPENLKEDAEQFASDLDSEVSEAENVSFPGMY